MATSREIARRYAAVTMSAMAASAVFKTARDGEVEDLEGNRYIDFISGYGVISTGWQRGEILAEGDYATVSKNPEVIQAYMGSGHG